MCEFSGSPEMSSCGDLLAPRRQERKVLSRIVFLGDLCTVARDNPTFGCGSPALGSPVDYPRRFRLRSLPRVFKWPSEKVIYLG